MNRMPSAFAFLVFALRRRFSARDFALRLFGAAADDEVVVISPHWDGIKDETARAFSAWHQKNYGSPATIRWREAGGGTTQIIALPARRNIRSNASAGIDVSTAAGSIPSSQLEKHGLLTPLRSAAGCPRADSGAAQRHAALRSGPRMVRRGALGFRHPDQRARAAAAGLPEVRTLGRPRRSAPGGLDLRLRSARLRQRAHDLRDHPAGLRLGQGLGRADGDERQHAQFSLLRRRRRRSRSGMGDAAYGVAIDQYGQAQVGLLRQG